MALRRRCIFCHKPVDKTGHCQNTSCIDYLRTKFFEEDQAKRAADAAAKEAAEKEKEKASSDTAKETTNTDTTTPTTNS